MKKWEGILLQKGTENGLPESVVTYFWNSCNASADYLFVKCAAEDTVVETPDGDKMMFEVKIGDKIKAFDVKNNKDHWVEVEEIYSKEAELYEVEFEDGRRIRTSLDHKYLCEDKKMYTLNDVITKGLRVLTD
jgi:intein/homing endonuclease